MKLPSTVQVAKFPPCGDGLRTLKPLHSRTIRILCYHILLFLFTSSEELIASGNFDICTLNDGALGKFCTHCFFESALIKCPSCQIIGYCSETCKVNII